MSNDETLFTALVAIIGAVAALIAAVFPALDYWQKHPNHRKPVIGIGVVLVMLCAFLLWIRPPGRAIQPGAKDTPGQQVAVDTSIVSTDTLRPSTDPPPDVVPPEVKPESPPPRYNDWLRGTGTTILYNASRLIPGGCVDGTMAVGDFSRGGWGSGPKVDCRPDGWLAFDTRSLLDDPGFFTDSTHCLNFVTPAGQWGQHGGAQRAPGMDQIGVPAAEGPQAGINIGFRIVKTASRHEVQFTNEGIEHCP